ncbi:MAG: hydrogen peroxide-dependent heme synthase [Actinomycetota bacterium]
MADKYAYYPVFSCLERTGDDPASLAHEVEILFKEWEDRIHVRGTYSTAAFREDADLMMWWVADSAEDVQELLRAFRATELGARLLLSYSFLGVARPPETAPDHIPAFLRGVPPKGYLCVYPFVRTHEWYLLPQEERAVLLREHGEMGREFPGVLANTTSAFGLGDWEWILAFESDTLPELVDCIRRLRTSRSRLYVKEETPFVTGTRKELPEAIRDFL